jgi:hypothetical protein
MRSAESLRGAESSFLERVVGHDERAWADMVRNHEPMLLALIRESGFVAAGDAPDVLSDLWLRLLDGDLRLLRRFVASPSAPLSAWLAMQAAQVANAHALKQRDPVAREELVALLARAAELGAERVVQSLGHDQRFSSAGDGKEDIACRDDETNKHERSGRPGSRASRSGESWSSRQRRLEKLADDLLDGLAAKRKRRSSRSSSTGSSAG